MANIFKDNLLLEKGQSVQPNLDAFTKNPITAGLTSVTTPTTTPQAISAENIMNPQTPAQLPKQPVNNMDFSGILASLKTLSEGLGKIEQPKQETNNLEMLFKQYLGEQTAPASTADMYQQSYDQSGVKAKQDLVNSLNSQLNAITASSQVAQQQLESQASGKDVTTQFLGRQQQEVGRQAAIKALPIAAQLASAQGDLTSAKSHLDTLFQIKSQDATNQYNYKNKLIDSVYSFASEQEKEKLSQKKIENDRQFTLERDALNNEHDTNLTMLRAEQDIAMQNMKFGQDKELVNLQASLKLNTNPVTNPSAVTNPVTGQPVDQSILDSLNLTNQLLENPKLKNISGTVNQFLGGFFGQAATAKNQYEQLKGMLSLDKRKLLKGSGAISDFESKMLESAASSLGRNLSDTEFRKQLLQIKGVFQTAAGGQAMVTVTDPVTKQSKTGLANSADINQAIASGYTIKYSE